MSDSNYDANKIKSISELEFIRLRPSVYIGELKNSNHLLFEVVDNALDEYRVVPFSRPIDIRIDFDTYFVSVRDYGRGVPHGTMDIEGRQVQVVRGIISKLYTGGKYDRDSYQEGSIGLNGIGLVAVNALSKRMEVVSYRKNVEESVISLNGGAEYIEGNKELGDTLDGTYVEYTPDMKFFESFLDLRAIEDRLKVASALVGTEYNLSITKNAKTEIRLIKAENGVWDLVPQTENAKFGLKNKINAKVLAPKKNDNEADRYHSGIFAFEYTGSTDSQINSYCNLLPNYNGGTHHQLIYEAVKTAWKPFIVGRTILDHDVLLGLNGAIAIYIQETAYTSQTKEKLSVKRDYLKDLFITFSKAFQQYLQHPDNSKLVSGLLDRFEEYRKQQNSMKSQKTILKEIHIEKDTGSRVTRRSVVAKLVECTSESREDTELLICEGDSAAGTLIQARDTRLHAVLPLRGKVLNVTDQELERVFQNTEVKELVSAIGAGYNDLCDPLRARYGKIIMVCDADADGEHISALLMSIFVNLMPALVKEGMVYVAKTPLFGWYEGEIFRSSQQLDTVPENAKYTRFKGLGELEPDQLYYSALNIDTRSIIQIQYPQDLKRFNEYLGTSWGRKQIMVDMGIVDSGV